MDRLVIRGGRRIEGSVQIRGAKNAALPQIAAALLSSERLELTNVPEVTDVDTMLALMREFGVVANRSPGRMLVLDARRRIPSGKSDPGNVPKYRVRSWLTRPRGYCEAMNESLHKSNESALEIRGTFRASSARNSSNEPRECFSNLITSAHVSRLRAYDDLASP